MQKAGATRIVSGHYARTGIHNGRHFIYKSLAEAKDQSYYLSLMDPFHIALMLYPYAEIDSKESVRELATELGLEVAAKRDSYEACFLEGEDYRNFLTSKIGAGREGDFILNGKAVGRHQGIFNYTIGQRRGLDISHTEPLYVRHIDVKNAEIELAEKPALFLRGVRLRETVFDKNEPVLKRASAKLRHKMHEAPCMLEIQQANRAVILFDEPQFAPAPGQVTTIYDGDRVIGGGTVDSTF
jgi:tRNA-specific 2-thiouridylase